MDLKLGGKRALVTGAAGGIGGAIARRLAGEGASLTLVDRKSETLADIADDLDARSASADLSTQHGVDALMAEIGIEHDILVHAAGVTGAKGDPLAMMDEDWMEALETDFLSGVRLARHLGPHMLAENWGRMVFVTSENAAQPYPDETVYNVSKVGLTSFAKSVSMAHAAAGLLANCVSPAFVATGMTDAMMDAKADEQGTTRDEAIENFLKSDRPFLALQRRGRPEEVAPVVALLCSDLASFVAGANWRVDGGSVASLDL
jgi:NAD(P)-dependent dehydrogenase (short-subunit alcohol dehydrogenase family)